MFKVDNRLTKSPWSALYALPNKKPSEKAAFYWKKVKLMRIYS